MLINEQVVRSVIRKQLLMNENKKIVKATAITNEPKSNSEKLLKKEIKNKRSRIKKVTEKYTRFSSRHIDAAIKEIFKANAFNKISRILQAKTSDGKPVIELDKQKGKPRTLDEAETKRLRKYIEFLIKNKGKINKTEKAFTDYSQKEKDDELDDAGQAAQKRPDAESGEAESSKKSNKSGSQAGKTNRKTSKKKPNNLIKKIQKLLNQLFEKGTIDGDYQSKKLDVDGLWGSRTRSASSKALSLFTRSSLRRSYGFQEITDKGLNKEKKGGSGQWASTLLKLVKGVTPEGEGSEDFEKGTSKKPYGKLIYVLSKLASGGGEGETESIFNAYIAARENASIYQKNSPGASKYFIKPGKERNSLKTEIDGKFTINPIGIDKIKFEFPYKISDNFAGKNRGQSMECSITFSYKATSNEDLSSAKVKILEMSDNLKYAYIDYKKAPKIKGKELSLSEWSKFGTGEDGYLLNNNGVQSLPMVITGPNFAYMVSFAVRIALLEKGRAANKEAGGDGSVKSFLGTGKEKKTSTGSTGSAGGSPTSSDEKDPAVEKYGEDNLNKPLAKLTPEQRKRQSVNLLRIPAGEYKDENISLGVDGKNRFNIVKDSEKIKNHLFSYAASDRGSLIFSKQDRSGRLQYDFYYADGRLKIDGTINYQISGYVKLEDGSLVPKDAVNYFKKLSDK